MHCWSLNFSYKFTLVTVLKNTVDMVTARSYSSVFIHFDQSKNPPGALSDQFSLSVMWVLPVIGWKKEVEQSAVIFD